jgi:hypothetical protein
MRQYLKRPVEYALTTQLLADTEENKNKGYEGTHVWKKAGMTREVFLDLPSGLDKNGKPVAPDSFAVVPWKEFANVWHLTTILGAHGRTLTNEGRTLNGREPAQPRKIKLKEDRMSSWMRWRSMDASIKHLAAGTSVRLEGLARENNFLRAENNDLKNRVYSLEQKMAALIGTDYASNTQQG